MRVLLYPCPWVMRLASLSSFRAYLQCHHSAGTWNNLAWMQHKRQSKPIGSADIGLVPSAIAELKPLPICYSRHSVGHSAVPPLLVPLMVSFSKHITSSPMLGAHKATPPAWAAPASGHQIRVHLPSRTVASCLQCNALFDFGTFAVLDPPPRPDHQTAV